MTATKRAPRLSRPTLRQRKRQAAARIELGSMLRHRRHVELRMSQEVVARAIGRSQGYYAELEGGTRSSHDVRMWLRLVNALQLPRERVFALVWEVRGSLPLALPAKGDPRRDVVLQLAIEQYGGGQPLPGQE